MTTLWQRLSSYLFNSAIQAAKRQSQLEDFALDLSFGQIAFLHRPATAANTNEAIFLLHGATADSSTWLQFCQHFTSDLALYLPDLAGHGKSVSEPQLDYGVQAQTQRLLEMLNVLGVKRVHVIGSSMGGAIALQLAAQAPQLVASLLLIGSAGATLALSSLTQQLAQGQRNLFCDVQNIDDYRALMRLVMEKPPYLPGMFVAVLARRQQQRNRLNQKIIDDLARDLDLSALLTQVQAPTLMLWGEQDQVLPLANLDYLQPRIAGSRKITLPGIGHVPMVEAPKQCAQICQDFYTQLTASASC